MYRPPKKLREFPLRVSSAYVASTYLYRSPTGYPIQAYLSVFGCVSDYRGRKIGRVGLRDLLTIRVLLRAGDNFCTVSGSEASGTYKLEVWAHSFGQQAE